MAVEHTPGPPAPNLPPVMSLSEPAREPLTKLTILPSSLSAGVILGISCHREVSLDGRRAGELYRSGFGTRSRGRAGRRGRRGRS